MDYIVIDLEWNQNPRGADGKDHGIVSEVIEIGAVKLNASMHKVDEFQMLIRPKVFKKLEYHIRKILNYDEYTLFDEGRPFPEVLQEFREWCGQDFAFCTWGSTDLMVLQENMDFYNLEPIKFPLKYYDMQKVFVEKYMKEQTGCSLDKAVDFLEIPEKLEFHSAINDARYTAAVIKKARLNEDSQNYVYDTYNHPTKLEERIQDFHHGIYEEISEEFPSKQEIMKDKELARLKCPICERKCVRKLNWFSTNSTTEFATGRCLYHGPVVGKIKFKPAASNGKSSQSKDDKIFVIKTIRRADEEELEKIKAKKDAQAKKRRELQARKMQSKKEEQMKANGGKPVPSPKKSSPKKKVSSNKAKIPFKKPKNNKAKDE